MIQHLLSVGAAVLVTLWATVLTQYHEFRGPVAPIDDIVVPAVVIQSKGASSFPSPFEGIVSELIKAGSSTSATTTKPAPTTPTGPVRPTTPSVPFKPLPVPSTPAITPTSPVNPTPPVPVTPTVPTVDAKLSDEALLKGAVVNVICLPGGGLRGSSGSGIVIDPRGIILTVAHVGQGFLLRDYPTAGTGTCYIRTGSPAKNAYAADLIYISPQWLDENPATFLKTNPSGTGENDFAFLAITRSISGTALPSRFTYIPLSPSGTKVVVGDEVGTGSYAAEFLTNSQIRSSLYPTIKFAEVDDVFTFSRNTVDIFSVAAGSAAQEGSSGGGVINEDNRLIGLISTRTVRTDLSQRSLQALTMDHIRRSFRAEMGADLDSYLKGGLTDLVNKFKPRAASLLQDLSEAIDEAQ